MPVKEAKDLYGMPSQEKFEFKDLLWQQLNRIGAESIKGTEGYLRGIETLRDFLSLHEDEIFLKNLEKLEKQYEEARRKLLLDANKNPNIHLELQKDAYIKARLLLREIMKLIKRTGYIPAKAVDFEETETGVFEDGDLME